MVIGKKGADIEKLRKEISKIVSDSEVVLNLVEVRKPEIEASLVADGLAQQLERRAAFSPCHETFFTNRYAYGRQRM